MGADRRNLELKARDPAPRRSSAVCRSLDAEVKGVLAQEDTYFNVSSGRLKLREEAGAPPHLIAYERANAPDLRESRYRIVEVRDGATLKAALADALGVIAVVSKTRELFLHEGVRIHLDQVRGLGSFIEFEALASPGEDDLAPLAALLDDLRRSFAIADDQLVSESYCDLASAGDRRSG